MNDILLGIVIGLGISLSIVRCIYLDFKGAGLLR